MVKSPDYLFRLPGGEFYLFEYDDSLEREGHDYPYTVRKVARTVLGSQWNSWRWSDQEHRDRRHWAPSQIAVSVREFEKPNAMNDLQSELSSVSSQPDKSQKHSNIVNPKAYFDMGTLTYKFRPLPQWKRLGILGAKIAAPTVSILIYFHLLTPGGLPAAATQAYRACEAFLRNLIP